MYVIRLKQALKAKVTCKSSPNAHGPHSCHTTFFLPACTYGLMESSLQSVDRGRFWPGVEVVLDNRQTPPKSGQLEHYILFFWDIPEGQW